MNIREAVNKINKNIPVGYYSTINEWLGWWRGYVKSFHTYTETLGTGRKKQGTLYSLKMAKKICEDWASYLLNEDTIIELKDEKASEFLYDVLDQIDFWIEANRLVEKAFYSGTGAFVLKLDGLNVSDKGDVLKSSDTRIRMEYLPALCIVPLTIRYNQIVEVAFVSKATIRGDKYVYIEKHLLENDQYVIYNEFYKQERSSLTKAATPSGVAERFNTGGNIPFFSIIKPNIVNPYPANLGLGCSIFSQAIDCLKGVDLAFNNFCRDFRLGGKKVFYNRELTKTVGVDKEGKPIYIAPDEMLQQLFVSVGDEYTEGKELVHEFNPDLRVDDNRNGVQAQIDYLSFMCGMGTRHYKFDSSSGNIVTATQYTGEKQVLKQNAAKHGIIIEKALIDITRAMLWAGKEILGVALDPETDIKVNFADGYITSDEEKRAIDRQDVIDRIMQPWEYRSRWYNETPEEAKAAISDSIKPGLF